jgi:ferredoxin--NADP+ reductase
MTELQTMRTTGDPGHAVLVNERLSANIHRLVVSAPRVAAAGRPGQFVIVRLGDGAERIPLTIAERHPEAGTIALVVQAVGKSTNDLTALAPGSTIHDVAGPLGRPSDLVADGNVVCVGGGVGAAVMLPIARGLADLGARVVTVIGARTGADVIYADEFAALGDLIVCTDDGSTGRLGLVTDALTDILDGRGCEMIDLTAVYAAGPVPMMRAVAALTRPVGVRTIVSLNPIMVDGTGMCGGCRVTVDGTMRFACVDGPEFDAHGVDFDELADRLGTYREFERTSVGGTCRSAR